MYLEEYLKRYAKTECSRLKTLIVNNNGTLKETVIKLLKKNGADK